MIPNKLSQSIPWRIKRNQSAYRQAGLTLLELILVLFLLGLMLTVVVNTLPSNESKALRTHNAQLMTSLDVLLRDARLQGRFFGIILTDDKWQLVQHVPIDSTKIQEVSEVDIDPSQIDQIGQLTWEPVKRRRFVSESTLPEGFHIQVRLGEIENGALPNPIALNEKTEEVALKPQIWVLPGGEITPFILEYYDGQARLLFSQIVDTTGQMTLQEGE